MGLDMYLFRIDKKYGVETLNNEDRSWNFDYEEVVYWRKAHDILELFQTTLVSARSDVIKNDTFYRVTKREYFKIIDECVELVKADRLAKSNTPKSDSSDDDDEYYASDELDCDYERTAVEMFKANFDINWDKENIWFYASW